MDEVSERERGETRRRVSGACVALVGLASIAACGRGAAPSARPTPEPRAAAAPAGAAPTGVVLYVDESRGFPSAAWIQADGRGRALIGPADAPSYPQTILGDTIALVVGGDGDDVLVGVPAHTLAPTLARGGAGTATTAARLRALETLGSLHKHVRRLDARTLVFEAAIDGFRDLYAVDVPTQRLERLTDAPEGSFDPAPSPDGKWIAFASSRAGQLDLWLLERATRRLERLTDHPGDAIQPTWIDGGRALLYLSGRDGTDGLLRVELATKKVDAITGPRAVHEAFAVSPDGRNVAFTTPTRSGQVALHVRSLVDGAERTLSGPGDRDSEPTWSPDGAWLAFTHTVSGVPNVWRVRADGSARAQLTHETRGAWRPRWFPMPTPSEGDSR
jgi:dipeptidyl aminopeptidase/acylaminoacyl peptidase